MTNMKKLSNPLESLIGVAHSPEKPILQTDFLVVGTGYGGAITAMRFGDAGRDVVMLERGRQYDPGDFPYDEGDLPAHMSIFNEEADERRGYTDALLNVHTGDHTDVMVGSGLGGTSLINANVAEMPTAEVFNKPAWPTCFRNGAETLRGDCERVRNLLGTARHPCGQYKSKYRALARLSDAIDRTRYAKARVTPANVAVRFEEGPNNVGVYQRKCTDCGNCVTGCNVGAKSTLDRNILPLAVSRGVKIYTGATVISLQPGENGGRRWRLRVTLTRPPTGTLRAESWYVDADHVILAAGTLGSSEILLRSRHSTGMKFSSKLGKQFSTNGDGLVMSYGQKSPVNAIAAAEQAAPAPEDKIGPTIIGMIRVTDITDRDRPASIVIEDASIPAALASLFIESSTTSAQMRRFVKRKLPPGVSRGADPLTPSRTTAQHGQALLVMGDDGARGELRLDDDAKGDETDSILRIEFPDVVDNPALVVANRLVKAQDRKAGLDGGQYAANPLWEPLPKEVAGAIGGARAKGRVVTVHPLGGCPMGDDIDLGVVDHRGRVFDPESGSKTGTYDGLYVCDGSIIPTALEINPFLTIAALAHRNAGLILVDAGWQESHKEVVDPDFDHAGTAPARIFSQEPVSFTIVEQ
ncbi:MAG TPA: GMC family oxidoreductase, partial [Pseudomonadales bacterium]|nr:GMC family oxidoreductase [Pseudomonadales bacterium]